LLFLLIVGCRKPEPTVQVERVLLTDDSVTSVRELKSRTQRAFADSNWAVKDEGPKWTARGLVSTQLISAEELEVTATFQLRNSADTFEIESSKSAKLTDTSVELKTQIGESLTDEVLKVVAQKAHIENRLLRKDDQAIISVVNESAHSIEKEVAVDLLTSRKNVAAIGGLVERLSVAIKERRFKQVRQTLGLLVDLKAPQSVNRIIEAFEGQDATPELIFAIANIGGNDATTYLQLLAEGHKEQNVREAAQRGLEDMAALQKRKPVP
jgi:hypothetical protein